MSDIDPTAGAPAPEPGGGAAGPDNTAPARKQPLWERALYMLLFAVIAHVLVWIFIASCVLQLIVYLVSDQPNEELREFTRRLLAYIGVTFAYLAFLQDEKPFPFSPFPPSLHRS